MSGSTRSRQKRKLEPISIEELAGTTGMSGFCTFLTRDNSVGVPALDKLENPAPPRETSAPDTSAPETPASTSSAPDLTAPLLSTQPTVEASAPESGSPQLAAPAVTAATSDQSETLAPPPAIVLLSDAADLTAPFSDGAESTAPDFRRRPRIREAVTVHEGHSLAEQAVYEAMYRSGKPHQGESRILTIGLRTLAEISRMAYSNCKANVRSLVAKLAIDERPGFSYTEGRTYLVYSLPEILRRRKAAGLTHVVRNRGVAFVDPRTGSPLPVHYPDHLSAPDSGAPISKSSAPEQLASVLRRYIEEVDEASAADLWHRCLQNAPDARVEEVAHFIELKAGKPGFRMPLGFLLSAVPKCFQGDTLLQFRQESKHSAVSRERQIALELLQNSEADEEQKQWAREFLATNL